MKLTGQLLFGYLTAAIFGMECCINNIEIPPAITTVDRDDNLTVEATVAVSPKLSDWSASDPSIPASADLFVDKLTQVKQGSRQENYLLLTEEDSHKYDLSIFFGSHLLINQN